MDQQMTIAIIIGCITASGVAALLWTIYFGPNMKEWRRKRD